MRHPLSRLYIAAALVFYFSHHCYGQDDTAIWREFLGALKAGTITIDQIRPLPELGDAYRPILRGFLDSVRTQASPRDWDARPEIRRTENRVHYIVPWTARDQQITYCFSFVADSTQWFFQHLEAITIRLDTVSYLPTSTFPDISDQQKAWAREEIYWSFVVLNVYLPVARDRGNEAALNMLKDGPGYFVGARTWVPFVAPHRAFILYLCWEQSHLRGNHVTLLKLDDAEAIVELDTHYFALYSIAAHFRPVISAEEYRSIFEAIWQDRASSAGWHLATTYPGDYRAVFHLTRHP